MIIDKLKRMEAKHGKPTPNKCNLPVYYGWAKINKIQKREALTVVFLNDWPGPRQAKDGYDGVTRWINPVYSRRQTDAEQSDARYVNRMYTSYSIYMDDKKIGGSLSKVLQANFDADKNHVSKKERERIREMLKTSYIAQHPLYKEPAPQARQLEINFIFDDSL